MAIPNLICAGATSVVPSIGRDSAPLAKQYLPCHTKIHANPTANRSKLSQDVLRRLATAAIDHEGMIQLRGVGNPQPKLDRVGPCELPNVSSPG